MHNFDSTIMDQILAKNGIMHTINFCQLYMLLVKNFVPVTKFIFLECINLPSKQNNYVTVL